MHITRRAPTGVVSVGRVVARHGAPARVSCHTKRMLARQQTYPRRRNHNGGATCNVVTYSMVVPSGMTGPGLPEIARRCSASARMLFRTSMSSPFFLWHGCGEMPVLPTSHRLKPIDVQARWVMSVWIGWWTRRLTRTRASGLLTIAINVVHSALYA